MQEAVPRVSPSKAIGGLIEAIGARRNELEAAPPFELRLDRADSVPIDRVFQEGLAPQGSIAEIPLHGDDLLGDGDRLLRRDKADDIGEAWERHRVTLCRREATAH